MLHGRSLGNMAVLSAALVSIGCHGWEPVSPSAWPDLVDRREAPPIRITTPTQTIEIEEPTIVRAPPGAPAASAEWQWRSAYIPGPAPFPAIFASGAPASRAYLGGDVFRAETGILVRLVPGRDQVSVLTVRPLPTVAGVLAATLLVSAIALTSGTLVYLMTFGGSG